MAEVKERVLSPEKRRKNYRNYTVNKFSISGGNWNLFYNSFPIIILNPFLEIVYGSTFEPEKIDSHIFYDNLLRNSRETPKLENLIFFLKILLVNR